RELCFPGTASEMVLNTNDQSSSPSLLGLIGVRPLLMINRPYPESVLRDFCVEIQPASPLCCSSRLLLLTSKEAELKHQTISLHRFERPVLESRVNISLICLIKELYHLMESEKSGWNLLI
ncbi:unnamed protein product, partial [Brassica napus]